MIRATWRRWLLIGIVLLAFGLRLYRLGAESLWYDETVSMTLAAKSVPALIAHTAGDIHPPGYYLLLHVWLRLAGPGEFAAAFPSLFFGMVLVALACWLGTRLFGSGTGLLAALLVAISPYNLWYSQEVRMYTLAAVLGMGVLAALLQLLVAPAGARARWIALAVYVVCGALGLWVLYYFAFLLVAVNLMAGVWWVYHKAGLGARHSGQEGVDWRWTGRWIAAQAAIVVLYAPWLPIAWRQATQPPVPPWRSFIGLGDVLIQTWTALGLGQSAPASGVAVWAVLGIIAGLFGVGLLSGAARRKQRWLLAGYVLLPVALIYLASLRTPLYHVRYVFTYSTPFYILVAAGLVAVGRRWRPAAWLALAAVVVASGASMAAYHTDARYAADDHRGAVSFLAGRWRPGDAILVDAGYTYTALLTYWDGPSPIAWRGRLVGDAWPAPPQSLPPYGRDNTAAPLRQRGPPSSLLWPSAGTGGIEGGPPVFQAGTVDGSPGLGWGNPDSDFYAMSQADTVAALERLFADYDRVWVYRIYDTVTDPTGVIRSWLQAHGTAFEDQVFTGESQLRVQGWITGRDPLAQVQPGQARSDTLADGALQLAAVDLPAREVAVGSSLDLALTWRVRSPLPEGAILFAGLFDASGARWAQVDERALGSLYPASSWPAGAAVRTPLRIEVPPGTPPGQYELQIGWYRFVGGQPRWLAWTGGDRLTLDEASIVAPADWGRLPLPAVQHAAGVTIGQGRRLLGFDAPVLRARPGDTLPLMLAWQALGDAPDADAGRVTIQLADDAGHIVTEVQAPAGSGPASAGQSMRQAQSIPLPGGLAAGAYDLSVGIRRADGTWLPVRRGPFHLGSMYPLATVFVESRPLDLAPPAVQHSRGATFGSFAHLLGYDLETTPPGCGLQAGSGGCSLKLTLHWRVQAPASVAYKIFLHLVEPGSESAIPAQADVYPTVPSTAWVAGEYLAQPLTIDIPSGLSAGRYVLVAGFYDEATGARPPVVDAAGQPMGNSLVLEEISIGQ